MWSIKKFAMTAQKLNMSVKKEDMPIQKQDMSFQKANMTVNKENMAGTLRSNELMEYAKFDKLLFPNYHVNWFFRQEASKKEIEWGER